MSYNVNESLALEQETKAVLINRYNTLKEHYEEIYNKINHESFKSFDELSLLYKKETLDKQIDLLSAKYVMLMDEFHKQKHTK